MLTVVRDYGRHNMPPSPPFLRETIVFETTMIIVATKTPSLKFFFFFFFCVLVHTLKSVFYITEYTAPEKCEEFQTVRHLDPWGRCR